MKLTKKELKRIIKELKVNTCNADDLVLKLEKQLDDLSKESIHDLKDSIEAISSITMNTNNCYTACHIDSRIDIEIDSSLLKKNDLKRIMKFKNENYLTVVTII